MNDNDFDIGYTGYGDDSSPTKSSVKSSTEAGTDDHDDQTVTEISGGSGKSSRLDIKSLHKSEPGDKSSTSGLYSVPEPLKRCNWPRAAQELMTGRK